MCFHLSLSLSLSLSQYSIGKIYFMQRKLPQAIAAHRRALALPPTETVPHAYVHNDLGNALSDMSGRQTEVMHHYQRGACAYIHPIYINLMVPDGA